MLPVSPVGWLRRASMALPLLLLLTVSARADYPQIRIHADTTVQLQNEQQVCVNPRDPFNIVACWRDFRLGYRRVGVGYSLDGGRTWIDQLITTDLGMHSDPVLTVGRDGVFYLAVLDFSGGSGANQISVYFSYNRGWIWNPLTPVAFSWGDTFQDKEWIALDRTGGARDGALYIAWTQFNSVTIQFVASFDGGESWSEAAQVSDTAGSVQWPVPIVLKNGSVLVAWGNNAGRIDYDISNDGGASWGTDRVLASTKTLPYDVINGGILVFPYPSLAMDETAGDRQGWVYCVYGDAAVPENGMDIWCRRSTDNGETWGAPVRVNDDLPGLVRDQFHPWVTCDERGMLTAVWYDRRDDPDNDSWHIYMAQSSDGGTTWGASTRLTTVPSSPGAAKNGFVDEEEGEIASAGGGKEPVERKRAGLIGEYSGVAVGAGIVHPVWTDTRNGNQDTYTTIVGDLAAVPEAAAGEGVRSLQPAPNPFRGRTELHLPPAAAGGTVVQIYDAAGRLVRELKGSGSGGEALVPWDGKDNEGRALPPGSYYARLPGAGERTSKLILLR
jgi:hypothetical protein